MFSWKRLCTVLAGVIVAVSLGGRLAPLAWAAPNLDGGGPPPTDTPTLPPPTNTPEPPTATPPPPPTDTPTPPPPTPVVQPTEAGVQNAVPESAQTAAQPSRANSFLGFLLCVGVLIVLGLAALNIWSRRPQ